MSTEFDPPSPMPRARFVAIDAGVELWRDDLGRAHIRSVGAEILSEQHVTDLITVLLGEAWLPTVENINALPVPVRQYIHDLETRCDHTGELRELILRRDQVVQLEARLAALEPQE